MNDELKAEITETAKLRNKVDKDIKRFNEKIAELRFELDNTAAQKKIAEITFASLDLEGKTLTRRLMELEKQGGKA